MRCSRHWSSKHVHDPNPQVGPRTKVFALEVRISGKWGSNQGKRLPRGNRPFTWLFEFRTETHKSGGRERKGLRRAIFARLRAGPVNRSAPKTPGNLPLSAALGQAESAARMGTGGGSAPGFEPSPTCCLENGVYLRRSLTFALTAPAAVRWNPRGPSAQAHASLPSAQSDRSRPVEQVGGP